MNLTSVSFTIYSHHTFLRLASGNDEDEIETLIFSALLSESLCDHRNEIESMRARKYILSFPQQFS